MCAQGDKWEGWLVGARPPTAAAAHVLPAARPQAGVLTDLVLLACVGIRPVMVHGGGPEINIWLGKLGIEAQFKNGLRVTDGKWPCCAGGTAAPPARARTHARSVHARTSWTRTRAPCLPP